MNPVMKAVTTRPGYITRVSVPRSPERKAKGAFNCQTRFGRSFFHMADIIWVGPLHGPHAEIREASVSKDHRLRAARGQRGSILFSEQGRFARVKRSVEAPSTAAQVGPNSLQRHGAAS